MGFDGCTSFLMKDAESEELKTAMFWIYRFDV